MHRLISRALPLNALSYAIAIILWWAMVVLNRLSLHPFVTVVAIALLLLSVRSSLACFQSQNTEKKKILIGAAIFSTALSLCRVIQKQVVYSGNIATVYPENTLLPLSAAQILAVFVEGLALFFTVAALLLWYHTNREKFTAKAQQTTTKPRWVMGLFFLTLMVSWGFYWLTFFPGTANSDNTRMLTWTVRQASAQHPWFYYYLLNGVVRVTRKLTGSINAGIAMYSFLQMTCGALIVSYTGYWIAKRKCSTAALLLYLSYFAASPMMANIAILGTKDAPFALLFLLLFPLLAELCEKDAHELSTRRILALTALLAALSLLRSNGILVAGAVVILCIILFKKHRKRLVVVIVGGVLLPALLTSFLNNAVFKTEPIFTEKIGIPLQQVAMTVVEGGAMTKEQEEFIHSIFPHEYYFEKYAPMSVDSMKWGSHPDTGPGRDFLQGNQRGFIKIWLGMLPRNLDSYVRAWLLQTYGFWSIGTGGIGTQGYYWDYSGADNTDLGIERIQVWPDGIQQWLEDFYRTRMNAISAGTLIWIVFFLALLILTSPQPKRIVLLSPVVFLWGTLMVSVPIAFGYRYAFPLFVSLPILIYLTVLLPGPQHVKKEQLNK